MIYTTKPPYGTQLNMNNPLNNGLVAFWILNEGNGNIVHDLSGNNNTGTFINISEPPTLTSGWNTSGRNGTSINLDGVDDYINIGKPSSLLITGAMTVEAWVKFDKFVNINYRIVSKQGGPGFRSWNINMENNICAFQIAIDTNNIIGVDGSEININEWIHLVGVYNPSVSVSLYKNGIPESIVNRDIPASQFIDNGLDINIGRRPDNSGYVSGGIDQVRIWNRALSSCEIYQLYTNPYDAFSCQESICDFTITQ